MKSIAVIGAGITGLTTSFLLKDKNLPVELYEASGRPGG
ncbi:MAG: NAD(P)-binding protein, partial [Verrucomicrobia bacterium]|nr:NAD(P)-binding protein [Verrucomicrobiota bacterium]